MARPKHRHAARWLVPALFAVAGAVTIPLVRNRASSLGEFAPPIPMWLYAGLFVAVSAVFLFVRKRMRARLLWEVFFTAAIFLGAWYFLLLGGVSFGVSLLIVAGMAVLHIFFHIAALHNLFFFLGCVGAAVIFAEWLPAEALLLVLVGFTVYDMVAGPPGGPVERLARQLTSIGFIPGFAFPARARDFFRHVDSAVSGNWVLLGTGDVILPLALVASAAAWDAMSGVAVTLGMLLGALFLIARKDLHPRAALPSLAAGAAVPFLVILFIRAFLS